MDVERRAGFNKRLDDMRARNDALANEAIVQSDVIDRIVDGTASPEEIERFRQQVAARVAHDFN